MEIEKCKTVCVSCGGENVNEERMISIRINTGVLLENQHIDFYCVDCQDFTKLIPELEYNA